MSSDEEQAGGSACSVDCEGNSIEVNYRVHVDLETGKPLFQVAEWPEALPEDAADGREPWEREAVVQAILAGLKLQ